MTAEQAERPAVRLVAHVQTWRPYTSCYPALLGLAGAALAGGRTPAVLVVAALAPVLGWVSGHYLGDYFDRRLDAVAKPQRPIPSGRLSPAAALAGGLVCAAVSLVALVVANWRILPVFAVTMAGIVGYSTLFKKAGFAGNVSRGALTALALVIGSMVAAPWPPWVLAPVAVGFLLHDTASNLVGTVRDVDGDRAGGYRSVPVRHGVTAAVRLAGGLWAAGAVLVAATAAAAVQPAAQLAVAVVAAAVGVAAFAPLWRPGRVTWRGALRSHELLVAERLVLAASVVAGALGPVTALALLVPALAFSVVTQALMRSRHEVQAAAVSGTPGREEPA